MFPYQRLYDLFLYIYQHRIVTPSQLSKYLHVSIRTIRTDVTHINDILQHHGAKLLLKRNSGYSIHITQEQLFDQFINEIKNRNTTDISLETPEDRIQYIIELLLSRNNYVQYEELEKSVYVSFNTLQNYLKTISKNVEKYHLEMINRSDYGVKIIGEEKVKRQFLMDTLQKESSHQYNHFSKEEYNLFKDIPLNELRIRVNHLFHKHYISITDVNLKNLVIHIAIMLLRIQTDNYIHFNQKIPISPLYQKLINDLVNELENTFHIYLSEGEKQYLYIHIVSNTDCDIFGIDNDEVYEYINIFLDYIYQDYNFDLREDSILIDDLFKHLKSILSTKIINPDKRNPILNTIKSQFPLPFEITLTSLTKTFSSTSYILDEDDAGYISLHIGAAIERCFNGQFTTKNVILVCDGSHATARILEARIHNYYSQKINIVAIRSCSQIENLAQEDFMNIDFLIATAPLKCEHCPVVIVDFSLRNTDIEAISKMLNILQIKEKNETLQFFDPHLFISNKLYQTKDELLTDLTQLLYENDITPPHFLESVMKREALAKTNINNIFAFPHAMTLCAKQTKVAVALLEKPLVWNDDDETVQIVFLLAAKLEEQKNMKKLYEAIVEIVNNSSLQKRILKSQNYEEFINALPR